MTDILKRLAVMRDAHYAKATARSKKGATTAQYFDGIAEGLSKARDLIRFDLNADKYHPPIKPEYDPVIAMDIIELIKSELAHRTNLYIRAHSEHAGTSAAHRQWEAEFKKSDNLGPSFGFGRNPHNVERSASQLNIALKAKLRIKAAYDYAVEAFIYSPREVIPHDIKR